MAPKHINTSGHWQTITQRMAWKFLFWYPAGNVLAQWDLSHPARGTFPSASWLWEQAEGKHSLPTASSSPRGAPGICGNRAPARTDSRKGKDLPDLPPGGFYCAENQVCPHCGQQEDWGWATPSAHPDFRPKVCQRWAGQGVTDYSSFSTPLLTSASKASNSHTTWMLPKY